MPDPDIDLTQNPRWTELFGRQPPLEDTSLAPGGLYDQLATRTALQGGPPSTPVAIMGQSQQVALAQQLIALVQTPGADPAQVLSLLQQLQAANPVYADDITTALLGLLRRTQITASPPAHQEPSFWSQPIDLSATISVPGAVSGWVPVVQYKTPPGYYARIKNYGLDVGGGYTYNGSLLFQITVNGLAVPSLNSFAEHRGSLANPRETYFLVLEDQMVSFNVQRAVLAGSPSSVIMALGGYAWRKRMNYEGTRSATTAY